VFHDNSYSLNPTTTTNPNGWKFAGAFLFRFPYIFYSPLSFRALGVHLQQSYEVQAQNEKAFSAFADPVSLAFTTYQ